MSGSDRKCPKREFSLVDLTFTPNQGWFTIVQVFQLISKLNLSKLRFTQTAVMYGL